MADIASEFVFWIDKAAVNGFIAWPQARAKAEIAKQAVAAGVGTGRITLWLWRSYPTGRKAAFAMARLGGDGGDRLVKTIHGAPPVNDALKGQFVFEQEKGP